MSKETFLTRFSLIIKRLERGPASFDELAGFLERESGLQGKDFTLTIRTLQRDIRHILEQFDIEIVNERKGDKRYYIRSRPEETIQSQRLIEAFDLLQLIRASRGMNRYVYFEPRQPAGLEHFSGLLYACSNRKIVNFCHTKFWEDVLTERTVHPLALRESRGRWYLLAVDTKDRKIKTFGLDRITDLDISKTSFREKYDLDPARMFEHSFGIINDEKGKPRRIELQLSFEQGQYLLHYPLHQSQRLVSQADDHVIIELYVKISHDLVMELLSFGEDVKVISPVSLAKKIASTSLKVWNLY